MYETVSSQSTWEKCSHWLQKQPDPTGQFTQAHKLLDTLSWNALHGSLGKGVTTQHLSAFLGTGWISTAHIDVMIKNLSARIILGTKLAFTVAIASSSLFTEILAVSNQHKSYTKKETPSLCRYEALVKESSLQLLYFPILEEKHWVAGIINFSNRFVGYGECLANWISV